MGIKASKGPTQIWTDEERDDARGSFFFINFWGAFQNPQAGIVMASPFRSPDLNYIYLRVDSSELRIQYSQ